MPTPQPLGRKVDLATQVEGLLPSANLDTSGAYSLVQDVLVLDDSSHGVGITTPRDVAGHVGSKRLYGGTGGGAITLVDHGTYVTMTVTPGVITGSGDMLRASYDPSNHGYVDRAALADSTPWTGLTGVPAAVTAISGAGTINTSGIADNAVTAAKLADNAVDSAALQTGSVTATKLASGVALSNLGFTPLGASGGTVAGQLVLLSAGPSLGPNAFSTAQLLLETNTALGGNPTIGFWNNQTVGPTGLSLSWTGGTADLTLNYSGGQSATLLSSLSPLDGAKLRSASVPASALASGIALNSLGYVPANVAGDSFGGPVVAPAMQISVFSGTAALDINVGNAAAGDVAQLSLSRGIGSAKLYLNVANALSLSTTGITTPSGRILTSGGFTVDGTGTFNAVVRSVRTNLDVASYDDGFNGLSNFAASANQYPRYGFTVPGSYGCVLYSHDATHEPGWGNSAGGAFILTTKNALLSNITGTLNAYGKRFVIPFGSGAPVTVDGDIIYEY